jgi:hypothetical protein
MSQPGTPVAIDAELIRASMLQGPDHGNQVLDGRRRHVVAEGDRAGDAAHG